LAKPIIPEVTNNVTQKTKNVTRVTNNVTLKILLRPTFAKLRPKFRATGNLIWASILGKPCKTYIANRLRSKQFGGLAKKQQIWGENIFISVLGKGLRVVGIFFGMDWHGDCPLKSA